jgi:pyruvate carboxylase
VAGRAPEAARAIANARRIFYKGSSMPTKPRKEEGSGLGPDVAGRTLLAANRSEIAIRVFRAANELGMRTVAVYAEEDRFSIHRFKADEAYVVGRGKGPVGAYLDIEGIVGLARDHGADMIHPGYGFLSENAEFARACGEAGITFVGPRPELLGMMGDKTAARALAAKAGVPVLPGTEEPVTGRAEALRVARKIGFPLIIKAAFGGGGRGMRVVRSEAELAPLLDEARNEAGRAFGNSAVFLEKYIPRAKHIEVQVLGDKHGGVIHLHERDCSVQRRHQKVVEVAPSISLPESVRDELCAAAVGIARAIGYDNAGTVEFLCDADRHEWFFIEMNPRIQVEHTVTEQITGIDLVRSQILVAAGARLHGPGLELPAQADIPRNGFAVQCRVTTEDPANNFMPNYGKLVTYRSAAGFGVRLDSGMGTTGSTITPFYDSLLVKITTSGQTFPIALQRMHRALREFRIRGVKTNMPFLENVVTHPVFRSGDATTTFIDTTPALFEFKPRRDRASKLMHFLADVTVNGNAEAKGFKPSAPLEPAPLPALDRRVAPPAGTRQRLQELGPEKFAEWTRRQKQALFTDTTFRDAHQSLLATRVRTHDMLLTADAVARRTPELFSLEMWGGATFDASMRFLREDPWERLRALRARVPNICFQMLLRGSNAVGYSNYPPNVVEGFIKHAAESGMDIFRVFDSLNDPANMRAAMEAVRKTDAICEGTICYTGDILDPARTKYSLAYYLRLARELEKMGAHFLAIKDMAGLCRPFAARALVRALRESTNLPIHFHTHDTSGINAASILAAIEAGADVVDAAISSMSGSTSQPNLNSLVAAVQHTRHDSGLDLQALNEFADYWERVRTFYEPFDTSPRTGSAEVYLHEMPGGQFTNLKEQAASMGLAGRWPEIARCYAAVNQLLGDIVKVTPSSKVVGDMTLFLFTRGINPADVPNLPPGTPFPESVKDMLAGGLGRPPGGWPRAVLKAVLGKTPTKTARAAKVSLPAVRKELAAKLKQEPDDDDLYSHLMYPDVFATFKKFEREFGDVSVLPTPAFFYGLRPGEEVAVEIEQGKTLFIKLVNLGPADKDGHRIVFFELNGMPREVTITDKSLHISKKSRPKADPAKPLEVGAPIPGMITSVGPGNGARVAKGDKLLVLEAMKMQTTLYAPCDGSIDEILVAAGDAVDTGDLLVRLRE